jgi:hypothetical protein
MAGSFGTPRPTPTPTRTTGGITGSGSKNVTPTYKMQGGMMISGNQKPQPPKKKKPSIIDKIKRAVKDELFQETHGTL